MNSKALVVSMQSSQFGNREPQIEVQLAPETHYRVVLAELHKVAAAIELATPTHETWNVHIHVDRRPRTACGRVYLELAGATADEANRALAVLRNVADQ